MTLAFANLGFEKSKASNKVEQQNNQSDYGNLLIDSQGPINALLSNTGVSDHNKQHDKHCQGDLEQFNKIKICRKLTCNNNDPIEVKHYLDPDNPTFTRYYRKLIESGVDDDLIIWSKPPEMSFINHEVNINQTPTSNPTS